MKKILSILLFAISLSGYSQVVVNGSWNRSGNGKVCLYDLKDGSIVEVARTTLSKDKRFGFVFYPDREGIYVIGNNDERFPSHKYNFYFKKNDELNVIITDTSYVLTGKNSAENKEMERWHNLILLLERYALYTKQTRASFKEFYPELERVLPQVRAFKTAKTGNAKFDQLFDQYREMDLVAMAADMVIMPKMGRPDFDNLPAFYKTINFNELLSDARLLQYPNFQNAFPVIVGLNNLLKRGKHEIFRWEHSFNEVPSDTLKGELALYMVRATKDFNDFIEREASVSKYLITASQKSRVKQLKYKMAGDISGRGQTAPVFTVEDAEGNPHKLTDFRGKVVVIDFWATWCQPCIQEIPHLRTLEERLEGKDVVFLSISIDSDKDHEKWKKYIADNNMNGHQYYAGKNKEEIAKLYDIKTIPRFIVIDKKGNLVSSAAPRPSKDKDLYNLIESELKK